MNFRELRKVSPVSTIGPIKLSRYSINNGQMSGAMNQLTLHTVFSCRLQRGQGMSPGLSYQGSQTSWRRHFPRTQSTKDNTPVDAILRVQSRALTVAQAVSWTHPQRMRLEQGFHYTKWKNSGAEGALRSQLFNSLILRLRKLSLLRVFWMLGSESNSSTFTKDHGRRGVPDPSQNKSCFTSLGIPGAQAWPTI